MRGGGGVMVSSKRPIFVDISDSWHFFTPSHTKVIFLWTITEADEDLHSKILDARAPVQFCSFSCSIRRNLAKNKVGAPSSGVGAFVWEIMDLPLNKSMKLKLVQIPQNCILFLT